MYLFFLVLLDFIIIVLAIAVLVVVVVVFPPFTPGEFCSIVTDVNWTVLCT